MGDCASAFNLSQLVLSQIAAPFGTVHFFMSKALGLFIGIYFGLLEIIIEILRLLSSIQFLAGGAALVLLYLKLVQLIQTSLVLIKRRTSFILLLDPFPPNEE